MESGKTQNYGCLMGLCEEKLYLFPVITRGNKKNWFGAAWRQSWTGTNKKFFSVENTHPPAACLLTGGSAFLNVADIVKLDDHVYHSRNKTLPAFDVLLELI